MNKLPKEVLGTIAANLPVNTILSLAATSRHFRTAITNNAALWRYKYEIIYNLETDAELAWLNAFYTNLLTLSTEKSSPFLEANGDWSAHQLLCAPMMNWYKAYLYRQRTAFNWSHGRFQEHIQRLPRLSQQHRYRVLGKSEWGAVLISERDRRLFLIGVAQSPYWRELSMDTLPDCVAYPEKAIVASNYVVVCGRVVYSHPAKLHRSPRPALTFRQRLLSRNRENVTTLHDTQRTWLSCIWVWHRNTGDVSITIHSPNSLQLQQLTGRWLLVRMCYPTDDPNCGNSRYRVLDLHTSVWCTGELIAATGFCHLHVSLRAASMMEHYDEHATAAVFVGFETKMHGLTSAFRWQLLSLGRQTPRVLTSGYCPYWPMLVRKRGTSARLDDQHVLLTVDFDRASTAQTYVGVLRFGSEKLQWREPMYDSIIASTPDKHRLLTCHLNDHSSNRHYTVRQLGKSDVLNEYNLPEPYRLQCLSSDLAYAYSPKTANSMVFDLATGDTIHSINPSGLTRCQLSFPTLNQLVLLHPYSGQLIICDFVPS